MQQVLRAVLVDDPEGIVDQNGKLDPADILGVLKAQKVTAPGGAGFSEPEAIKILVAPRCAWDRPLRNLNRLDFIPRDLAFAGTLSIQLDVDCLVGAADRPHPDWKLLRSLSQYMSENVYESLHLQLTSTLYQRALAALLIAGKVTLAQLFGTDLEESLNDNQLRAVVKRTAAGKQVFDSTVRDGWHAWPIKAHLDDEKLPSEVEKDITGHAKGHLSRHVATRATCIRLSKKDSVALAICHRGNADRPEAKTLVKLCRSLQAKHSPQLEFQDLASALYEGLVDRECKHGLGAAVKTLSAIGLPIESLRPAAELVNRRSEANAPSEGTIEYRIAGFTYSPGSDFNINAMHAAISGDETVRKNLGFPVEQAASVLWWQLLTWQSTYFAIRPTKTALTLLSAAQDALAARVITAAATAEADLEIYTLLESLKHPASSVSFRVSLPNLKLMKEDATVENEYDVVTVILKKDKEVEVWIWGVTTQADINKKRLEDHAKIQKLKDHLGNRWGADVKTVENYVHKDGNEICLEVDGRQERRTFTLRPAAGTIAVHESPASPGASEASSPLQP